MIAAVMSQDPVMLATFRSPEYVSDGQGNMVANTDADMHTQTAQVILPEVFKEADGTILDRLYWVARAKDESRTTLPGTARDLGKKVYP